jgi:FkbM family methyltransferase
MNKMVVINDVKKFLYTNYPQQYGAMKYSYAVLTLPIRLLLLKMGITVSFSGKEQDRWVMTIMNGRRDGYFVDLAATSGIIENNTYILERKYGWRGICIEPNRDFFQALRKNRDVVCVNYPVSSSTGEIVEFVINGGVGGIISDDTDNNYNMRANLISTLRDRGLVVEMKTKTLESILKFYDAPSEIDYLSLDVEGSEFSVLKNFPFHEYRFMLMTIERPPAELCNLLFENNYVFVKNHKVDTFFAHKTAVERYGIETQNFVPLSKKSW